jgi:hypothetical protein
MLIHSFAHAFPMLTMVLHVALGETCKSEAGEKHEHRQRGHARRNTLAARDPEVSSLISSDLRFPGAHALR